MSRVKRKWCRDCDKHVAAVHQGGPRFGLLHLALTILTAGAWLIVFGLYWLIVNVLTFWGRKWVCPNCGRRI